MGTFCSESSPTPIPPDTALSQHGGTALQHEPLSCVIREATMARPAVVMRDYTSLYY
jgi:hypothetical protein